MMASSSHEPSRLAAATPSGMPITSAMTIANTTISSVCGKQRSIEVNTASLEISEVERSPCSAFHSHAPYWSKNGRSRP